MFLTYLFCWYSTVHYNGHFALKQYFLDNFRTGHKTNIIITINRNNSNKKIVNAFFLKVMINTKFKQHENGQVQKWTKQNGMNKFGKL